MAISANAREVTYVGDGSTVAFAFSFPVSSSSEVKVQSIVTSTGVVTDMTGSVTIALTAKSSGQTLYPGGTVTYSTAPAATVTVRIWGDTARTSSTIGQNDTLYAAGLETRLDILTNIVQEIDRDTDKIPRSSNPLVAQFDIPEPSSTYNDYVLGVAGGIYTFVQPADFTTDINVSGNAANRIPYWTDASTLSAEADFAYNPSTKTQTVDNIAVSALTASRVVVTDASKVLASSSVTSTELGYVSGVTSSIQTQLDAVSGVTSSIQTQLDALATTETTYAKILNHTTTPVTVGDTVTETSIYSFSVPGGSLSTNRRIGVKLFGKWSGDGSHALTIRAKYGATTICSLEYSNSVGIYSNDPFNIQFDLTGSGATGTQNGFLQAQAYAAFEIIDSSGQQASFGTATEDSTADKTLNITVQWTVADNSDTYTMIYGDAVLY